jgi:hypothetical protein
MFSYVGCRNPPGEREISRMSVPAAPSQPQDTQALQNEVQRLDGIAGVLLQTGFAVTAGALTIVEVSQLSTRVEAVLVAAAVASVAATLVAAVALAQRPSFSGLAPDTKTLESAYRKKRARCAAALIILSLTIELAAALVGFMS